jgi:hypothetical protein
MENGSLQSARKQDQRGWKENGIATELDKGIGTRIYK